MKKKMRQRKTRKTSKPPVSKAAGRAAGGEAGLKSAQTTAGHDIARKLTAQAERLSGITMPAEVKHAIEHSKESIQVPIEVGNTSDKESFVIPAGTPIEAVNYILGGGGVLREARERVQEARDKIKVFLDRAPNKREPLLADLFLRNRQPEILLPRKIDDFLKAEVRNAKRVVLDKEGSRYLAEFMRDAPDLIAQHQQYAIPPYEKLWVEFDAQEVFRATSGGQEPDPTADQRLGYLFLGNEVYGFVSGNNDTRALNYEATVSPVKFTLHRPWQLHEQVEFAELLGVSRLQLVSWAWGGSFRYWVGAQWSPKDEPRLVLAKTLRNSHTVECIIQDAATRRRLADIYYQASAGEMRNIISILLLMNQPQVVRYIREIGHSKGFVRGKLRTYLSHSVVSIHANPEPALRKVYDVRQGSPHRRHEVRGHFCRNKLWREGTAMGCEHVTKQLDPDHWECTLCGGKLWHRKEHMRGDASLGFVTKDYNLTE